MITELPPVCEIKRFFPVHRKCVVKVFFLLVQCILRCRTVCLYKCRSEVGSVLGKKDIKLPTAYKRLIRFFKIKSIDAFCIGIIWMIIHMVNFHGQVFMSMDRTNWKIGSTNINVLYIGLILPNGIFIPVLWQLYDKRGNTSEQERGDFLQRFFSVWQNHSSIEITLLADREFIGAKWFGFLRNIRFSFIIRARWQDYWGEVSISLNKTIAQTEKHILKTIKKQGYFQTAIVMEGELLYYTVFPNTSKRRDEKDKWMVLITDKKDIDWISTSFPKRWGIEVFFYHSKSNGFNLEDLNLTNYSKAQLMMGVTAICYVLSILKGIDCQGTKQVSLKDYGDKKTRSISLFRLGYDNLKNEIHSVKELIDYVRFILPRIPKWKSDLWKIKLKSVQ